MILCGLFFFILQFVCGLGNKLCIFSVFCFHDLVSHLFQVAFQQVGDSADQFAYIHFRCIIYN